jgi:hypothetical protein
VKRRREPRPKLPTEVPLDDGAREGTDRWRELAGVQFCHWDRWLLRLAVDEPDGLRSIARTLQRRTSAPHAPDLEAEALLAQLADLEIRLTALGRTPATTLDDVERESTWLHAKAFRRVWHAASFSYTEAMRRTPRTLLEQRARSGNWHVFPISPAAYVADLASAFGDYWHDHRTSQFAITLFELAAGRLLGRANTDDERLAIRRAALTAAIDSMARVDDSFDELGQQFRDHERAYLELLRRRLDRPGLLRDLLELVVWEDGVFHEVEPFLRALPEPEADPALRDLASMIAELRAAGLERQLAKARDLRRAVLAAAEAFTECEEVSG